MSNKKHFHDMFLSLTALKHCSDLCDGEVILSDGKVNVQRNILAAGCPYFRALLKYEAKNEDARQQQSYRLEELSCDVFEQILDFIYTSDLKVTDANVQELLQAADLLLLDNVKTICSDYLEECLTVSNCVGILGFAERFSCPRVQHLAQQYIDDHFTEVSYGEEFLQLEEDPLRLLLQRRSLMITSEDCMYVSLRRWLEYNPAERDHSFPRLLHACVNLALLGDSFLHQHVLCDPAVKRHGLEEWILSKRVEPEDKKLLQQRGFCNVVVVSGGEGPTLTDLDSGAVENKHLTRCLVVPNTHGAEVRSASWLELTDMNTSRVGHMMAEAGGFLFAIGGRDHAGYLLNTGEKYDPVMNSWSPIPPMNHARIGFGLVAIDDKIYAIGGSNDMTDPLTSMEEYDIYANRWTKLPDLSLKRAWSAYAVCKKKIYVMGGGVMGKLYEAVECYDPRTQSWTSVAPLKERRFAAQAVGVGSQIFIFGGLRRSDCPTAFQVNQMGGVTYTGMKLCMPEIFDLAKGVWNLQPRDPGMSSIRDTTRLDAALLCGDEIVVVGQIDMGLSMIPGQLTHCVRALNVTTNRWRCVAENHPPGQTGMAAAILRVPRAMLLMRQGSARPSTNQTPTDIYDLNFGHATGLDNLSAETGPNDLSEDSV